MVKPAFNAQLIEDYLLGALPQEEVERLDELSFTDDSFEAAVSAAEKDLVDAYVHNELTGEQLKRFTTHYLTSPLRLQKARFAEAFQTLMERESRASKVFSTRPVVHVTGQSRFAFPLSMFASRSLSRWALVAAVVALVGISVWLGIQNARLRQQAASAESQLHELQRRERELQKAGGEQLPANSQETIQKSENEARATETQKQQSDDEQQRERLREPAKPGQQAIASFVLTPQRRNVGEVSVVTLPRDTLNVRMNLKLEPNDYRSYRVALVDPDTSQVLWRSGKLARQESNSDNVGVSLRASLLKPKTYSLHLFGTPADGPSQFMTQYSFKVVKQ
jgi:hypothetical protein